MFELSEKESLILGYRIARGDMNTLAFPEKLCEELRRFRIDVLKLTLKNTPDNLYQLLDGLNLKYYLLGVVLEYKSSFQLNTFKPYINEHIEFIEYEGENPEEFKQLVKNIFQNSPASYYINPGLVNIMDAHKQLECMAEYVSTLNKKYHSHYYTHLLKVKGEPAGFVTSFKKGDGGGASYAGVLKKFEGKGLYLDIISFIQNYGKEIGQKWGTAYAQLHNTVVQKAFQKGGLRPSGYEINVHVNCFYGNLADSR